MKRFRTCSLDQPLLLPPSLQDWLPERHLARFVAQITDELDLGAILAQYGRKDGRGKAAYHPVMMVRLLLYGYAVGVRSSRRIEKATYDDVAFRYLAAGHHPDHDVIAEFRRAHLEALSGIFLQCLGMCQKAGLVKLGQVAIDGTKIVANASRRANLSYERLSERESELAEKVRRLLEEAEAIDREEDVRFGKGQQEHDLPEELATTERQLAKIRAAKAELEREAREKAEQAEAEKRERNGKAADATERKRWYRARTGLPESTAKGNCTDPESRLMKDGASHAWVQGYNAQLGVSGVPQIIVAQDVVNEPNDKRQLSWMMSRVSENVGDAELTLADAGYWNEKAVADQVEQGRDVLVPPDKGNRKENEPLAANAPQGKMACWMRERLKNEQERARYRKRSGIVEPVFGWVKEILGYRRFLLRGLKKVQGEWALICTAVNLGKLYRSGKAVNA